MEVIFQGFGLDIIKRAGRFYIVYDNGEIAAKIVESEITEAEAAKAKLSERDAYEVILAAQARASAN